MAVAPFVDSSDLNEVRLLLASGSLQAVITSAGDPR
jgi:hypothetical protein